MFGKQYFFMKRDRVDFMAAIICVTEVELIPCFINTDTVIHSRNYLQLQLWWPYFVKLRLSVKLYLTLKN